MYIIAIDGPAGAGKGTIAAYLSTHFALKHLDTGLLYRFVALKVIENNIDPLDETAVVKLCYACTFDTLSLPLLKAESTASVASRIAVYPEVRTYLNAFMKRFCQTVLPPYRGAILDGRDIGTVVCPEAHLKLFITADPLKRAARRQSEMKDNTADYREELQKRDTRDQQRATAPLMPAHDAIVIDTSDLTLNEMCAQAAKTVEMCLKISVK